MAKRYDVSNRRITFLNTQANYTGEFSDKKMHPDGFGEAVLDNGDKFRGQFSKGDPVHGKYTFANGTYCHVSYTYNFSRTRYTTYYLRNEKFGYPGYSYDVNWSYSNGEYHGQAYKDERHGVGCYDFDDGSKYIGGWNHGKRHGVGMVIYSDGEYDWCVYDNGDKIANLKEYRKYTNEQNSTNDGTYSYAYESDDNDYSSDDSSDDDESSFDRMKDDLFDKALYEINYGSKESALDALKRLRSYTDSDDYYFEDSTGHQIDIDEQIEEVEEWDDEDEDEDEDTY